MKKFFIYIFIFSLSFNYTLSQEYLDAYSLDKKKIESKLTSDVLKVFNLNNSVNSKKSYGGTSFDNIKKMIMKYKKQK